MANPNAPFGFSWIGDGPGGPSVTGATVHKPVQNSYTTQICRGDLVISNTTGYIQLATAAPAGNVTYGVFEGVTYISTAQGTRVQGTIWPTGDHAIDGTAIVIPISGTFPRYFKVQTLSFPVNASSIGQTIDLNVGTQSVIGGVGVSGMTVDATTLNGNNSGGTPFIIIDVWSNKVPIGTPGTNNTINNNIIIVRSNPFGEAGV